MNLAEANYNIVFQ